MRHRPKFTLGQTLVVYVLVVGLIVMGAVVFSYPGEISLSLGTEGLNLKLDGTP